MSTKNIIKFITLLLSVLVFGVSLISTAFAQVEVPPSVDIYKNYEGWYKNFIVECGACRITVRNYDGGTLYDYVVYPKQFENNSEIQRKLNWEGLNNQKDSEGRTIFFMQKNEGKLNLNDYTYKALNGSELEKKYSNNIPQLAKIYDNNKKELPYVYFDEFSKYTTVDDWKNYNNGENVNKLATDLGIDVASLCKNPVDGKELSFYEWVITPNAEGISPSLEVQPITLYPESTEQIYCNDFYTAAEFGMQWNSDLIAYCTELSNGIFDTIGRFFDGVFAMLFGAKKIGIGDLITFYSGKLIYYDVGITVIGEEEAGWTTGPGSTKHTIRYDLAPKYVPLTYTETTKYSHPWETRGFFANYQKIPTKTYTLEDMLYMYYYYSMFYIPMQDEYDPTIFAGVWEREWEPLFRNLSNKTESSVESLIKSQDKYVISFKDYYTLEGYKREGNKFNSLSAKGIGDTTTIKTDHNKYVTIIENDATKQKTLDVVKAQASFNCSNLPKYGAGIICAASDKKIATQSQILIKFNNNLEQIGGGGSTIDEEYNLIGTIGSNEYVWQVNKTTTKVMPKT